MALQDALHYALRTHPTCNSIRAIRSTNELTTNALRTQQFSSQRRSGEFSRVESPTRQGEAPVYPDASVSSLDHPAGAISSRDDHDGRAAAPCWMKGCTVALRARWRRLVACRCATFFRGLHHLLTCSIPNGGGPDLDGTWETGGKRRGRPKTENVVAHHASACHWWSSSSTVFRW